jgi:potassium efflux system protein
VPVGVSKRSEVPHAKKMMFEASRENDMIIDEPAPSITFDSFGDNALTLTARVYIDDLDNRIIAISDLHSTINEKFAEARIVIAYPQRDVHLDTSKPLEIRINKDKQHEDQASDASTI